MKSLKIGHHTHPQHGTGVSVFLFDRPSPTAYHLCGSSPATLELHLLELDANVPYIDGLVFTGGSAFGLHAVGGVMQWFQEQGRGHKTPYASVPIIPAASIFDLSIKSTQPPTASEAYQACREAIENNPLQGRIGAGTGASVGKFVPTASRMSGGVGFAELTLPSGVSVLAYAVVNSLGDVRDAKENIIAGARFANGEFANCEKYLLAGHQEVVVDSPNTTLVAVFTNAKFSKIELKRIAKVGLSGMARAISPVFTCWDGDVIFCASLGDHIATEMTVSAMAAEVVRQAIMNAVKESIIL
ncbi:MAG: P1 family peptidase [Gammaproteobacteria bacterium]